MFGHSIVRQMSDGLVWWKLNFQNNVAIIFCLDKREITELETQYLRKNKRVSTPVYYVVQPDFTFTVFLLASESGPRERSRMSVCSIFACVPYVHNLVSARKILRTKL